MNLKEAIVTAASATQAKGTMPVLSMLAIKSELGCIEFTGTDLETGIKTKVLYDAPDFSCCVDAKRLVAAINIIDNPKLKLTDKHLIVQQGSMRFTFPYLNFDSHPGLAKSDNDGISLSGDVVDLLSQVRYASAKNDIRVYLNGAYIQAENGNLSVIASDGHRIAVRERACDRTFTVIIPNKAVNHIIKHQPDTLMIGRMVHCIKPDFEMVCAPIESKFPDFRKALVKSDNTLTLKKSDLNLSLSAFNSLRDVSPFAGVSMEWANDELVMLSRGGDDSEVENKIPASFTENGMISVNANYLADLSSSVSGDELTLEFVDSSHPICSRREGALDLIMPMRM